MGWGAAIGGIASAAGALGSTAWGAGASKEAAEVARDWELTRATNAHQWEVQDLKAAGLNPILSAGGQGAATSGIVKPMPDTSGLANAGTAFVNALNTAAQTAKYGAETATAAAQARNLNADTKNKNDENALIRANTELAKTNAGLQSAQTTFQNLKNIQQKVQSDNAKVDFWNRQINMGAQSAHYISEVGSTGLKGIEKMTEMFGGKKKIGFQLPHDKG